MDTGKLLPILIILLAVSVTSAAVLFAFPYDPLQPPEADDTGSDAQGVMQVVEANNRFALEMYTSMSENDDGNMFFSPYSISAALAMTYEGAKGQTADEIKSVFHFPESSVLRPNFASIYNDINNGGWDYEMRTGNALWVQEDYELLEEYMHTTETYYGGKATNLDFVKMPEESRQTINSFIEQQTNHKIKDLIPSGALNAMTRLVLTNAIYFKGTWVWQFDLSDTRDRDFHMTSDESVKAPMMYMDNEDAEFNYADTGSLQILELPYKGGKISMLILLPAEDIESIEDNLTIENLEEWKGAMRETVLDGIYMPKFEFDAKYTMNDVLTRLGMPTAFLPPEADFSGITGSRDLFISKVIHQAYVKVDEQGTEAAAATAVIMEFASAMPTNIFMADHPFIFIIQDNETGNILFMGRVNDPTA